MILYLKRLSRQKSSSLLCTHLCLNNVLLYHVFACKLQYMLISYCHRIRLGELGLPILAPSAMEQKLGVFGSLPNSTCKLTEQLYATSRALLMHPNWVGFTCNAAQMLSAASKCIMNKTQRPPSFSPSPYG